ncbi:MAG: hypothetical protein QOI80_2240, partial [Solirubrobacteraceae bacterium]|nr:hypothetical protein [Solirubrobacteraceae bacterium]
RPRSAGRRRTARGTRGDAGRRHGTRHHAQRARTRGDIRPGTAADRRRAEAERRSQRPTRALMRRGSLLIAVLVATLVGAAPASARRIDTRTIRITPDSAQGSTRPVISDDGSSVVFDSDSSSLVLADSNGGERDVFVRDIDGGGTALVSSGPEGAGGNGPSQAGAISADGFVVAFESDASNLVGNDVNGTRDIFVRGGIGPVVLLSAGVGRTPANGPSREADVSADGGRVVFSSDATNLVAGDNNGVRDVFVRDLRTGSLTRVSQTRGGQGGNGDSSAPAISPDGRYVSFASAADNLVPGDTSSVPDVFLAELKTGRLRRVSVSSHGKAQNRAVDIPFVQVSDVSRGGRSVVFDSDATNLVRHDRRGHTDVFVRDMRKGTTTRLSVGRGVESNSDSVYPRITPGGRFVTFESFANNLFPLDARGPDSFLLDRRFGIATLLDVTNAAQPREPRPARQLLQRPSVSADANVAAFTSYARLTGADVNRRADAYVRRTDPPRTRLRVRGVRYRITADDRHARFFFCRVRQLRGRCKPSGSLAFLPHGTYTLVARAWGAGMRLSPPDRVRFRR